MPAVSSRTTLPHRRWRFAGLTALPKTRRDEVSSGGCRPSHRLSESAALPSPPSYAAEPAGGSSTSRAALARVDVPSPAGPATLRTQTGDGASRRVSRAVGSRKSRPASSTVTSGCGCAGGGGAEFAAIAASAPAATSNAPKKSNPHPTRAAPCRAAPRRERYDSRWRGKPAATRPAPSRPVRTRYGRGGVVAPSGGDSPAWTTRVPSSGSHSSNRWLMTPLALCSSRTERTSIWPSLNAAS